LIAKSARSDYSFGDTATAGERLAHVARVFEAPSRALLGAWGRPGCALAVDIGCGPGHTTRLVHEVLGCCRTVGLDASAAFVEAAARGAGDGIAFIQHDALVLPFPTGPADLIYARFLVTHLGDPERAVRGFASQLRPGGRLLLEEVESIETDFAPFRRYLALVEGMLAARGQCLMVGGRLPALAQELGIASSRVCGHPVPARDAAIMFSLNLAQLRHNQDVRGQVSEAELDALAADLAEARGARGGELAPVAWGLRQLAIEGGGLR
jgi:SAM-dependent methyltransferase